jgi:predicted RNase H-like HicB family nuclease
MKSKADKYTYRVGWSEEDSLHVARCLEFPSLGAHGKTSEEALREIIKVVAATLQWMSAENEPIPEPLGARSFRGNLTLRVPPEIHRNLAIRSAEEGVSINQYILSRVSNT